MAWNKNPLPTENTALHQRLHDIIEQVGFEVEDEVPVPGRGYRIDCYVREAHIALEADGPQHKQWQRKKDAERDEWLLTQLGLPTMRVVAAEMTNKEAREVLKDRIRSFADWHMKDYERRRQLGRPYGLW